MAASEPLVSAAPRSSQTFPPLSIRQIKDRGRKDGQTLSAPLWCAQVLCHPKVDKFVPHAREKSDLRIAVNPSEAALSCLRLIDLCVTQL